MSTSASEGLIAALLQSKCTDEEVLTFLVLLVRSDKVVLEPATSAALFARLGELIGAQANDNDEQLQQKLGAYYRAHPPSPALEKAANDFFQSELGVATSDAFDAVAAKARAERHEPIPAKPVFDFTERK